MDTSKAEKIIPFGSYCYTITKIMKDRQNGGMIIKTKNCKYFTDSYCAFMQDDIDDQVKVCNINVGE